MRILAIRQIGGPSLFHEQSCVCASTGLTTEDRSLLAQYEDDLSAAATELLAGLGSEPTDLEPEPAGLPGLIRVAAALCVALLRRSGARFAPARVTRDTTGSVFHIALPEFNHRAEFAALEVSLSATVALLPEAIRQPFLMGSSVHDPKGLCDHFVSTAHHRPRNGAIADITVELRRRSAQWTYLDRYTGQEQQIQVGFGRYQRLFNGTVGFNSAYGGIKLSLSKLHSSQFLADLGFPVTRQLRVSSAQEAVAAGERIGYPVVIKMDSGGGGSGVICDLRNAQDLALAYEELAAAAQSGQPPPMMFVENYVEGEDFRITLVGGKVLHVLHREPAAVVGDGQHTIAQLVEIENRNPDRGEKGSGPLFLNLTLGAKELQTLGRQNLSPDSVPASGQRVKLRTNANWSTGGLAHYVDDELHPDNREFAERIARAIDIDLLGLDVITRDIGQSFTDQALTVIEVNCAPGFLKVPRGGGQFRNEAMAAIDLLLPNLEKDRMPLVVAVSAKQTPELLARAEYCLQELGYAPAVAGPRGLRVAGELWSTASQARAVDPALMVVRNPEVDIGVIERGPETIVTHGLGAGGCDIGVLLEQPPANLTSPVWPSGISGAEIVCLLLRACTGRCVVNIDAIDLGQFDLELDAERLCLISQGAWSASLHDYCEHGAIALAPAQAGGLLLRTPALPDTVPVAEQALGRGLSLVELALMGILLSLGHSAESAIEVLLGCR